MTTLQTDILEIYNTLVVFSDNTIKSNFPVPITVYFDDEYNALVFEQKGKTVFIQLPVYYCLGLETIKKNKSTYLLPKDYDYLMNNLQSAIASGKLLENRTCLSPENYGFNIFSVNPVEIFKGPDIICQAKFISGTSRLFKYLTKRKYKL